MARAVNHGVTMAHAVPFPGPLLTAVTPICEEIKDERNPDIQQFGIFLTCRGRTHSLGYFRIPRCRRRGLVRQAGQETRAHVHPTGRDTWTVLAGTGDYYLDSVATTQPIKPGDVVIAHTGEVHGVVNNGEVPLMFVSVVAPADAGYQLAPHPVHSAALPIL